MDRLKHLPLCAIGALLLLTPLPFASAQSFYWQVALLVLSVAGVGSAYISYTLPARAPVIWMVLAFVLIAWALLPVTSVFPANAIWQNALALQSTYGSLDLVATVEGVLRLCLYFLAFILAFVCATANVRHGLVVLKIFILIATACAVYGLLVFALGNTHVLWEAKRQYMHDLTGPFVNRNHFATYLGMGTLAALALYMDRVLEQRDIFARRAPLLLIIENSARWHALWPLLCAVVMLAALLLTHSRAGLFCFMCGMVVLMGCFALSPAYRAFRGTVLTMASLIVWGAALLLLAGGGGTFDRMENVGDDAVTRAHIYSTAWVAFQTNPWLGTGLGTFDGLFNLYKTPDLFPLNPNAQIEHAHNTYLENMIELGAPAAAALLGLVLLVVATSARGVWIRKRHGIYPAIAVAASVQTGAHSLVDFPLQIPAVMVALAVLLGLGAAQGWSSREAPRTRYSTALWRFGAAGFSGVVFVVTLPAMVAGWYELQAYRPLRDIVLEKSVKRAELETALAHLQHEIAWQPSARAYADKAFAELTLARALGPTRGHGAELLEAARTSTLMGLEYSPTQPVAWYRLAYIRTLQGAGAPEIEEALTESILTGPGVRRLLIPRIQMALTIWPSLSPDFKQLIYQQIGFIARWRVKSLIPLRKTPLGRQVIIEALGEDPLAVKK